MQTFMARFVRPNGDRGVLYVLSSCAGLAVLDVMRQRGPMAQVNVTPRRCAALLASHPGVPAPRRTDDKV